MKYKSNRKTFIMNMLTSGYYAKKRHERNQNSVPILGSFGRRKLFLGKDTRKSIFGKKKWR